MSFKTALIAVNLIIFAVFASLSISYMYTTDLLDREANQLVQAAESINFARAIENKLLSHNRYAFLYELHKNSSRLEGRQKSRLEINILLMELKKLAGSEKEHKLLVQLKSDIMNYFDQRDNLTRSKLNPTQQYIKASLLIDDLVINTDKLIQFQRKELNDLTTNVTAQNKFADKLSILLLCCGTIILLFVSIGIIVEIYKPVMNLSKIISKYKSGEQSVRAPKVRVKEINGLSENFNSMAENIEEKQKDQLNFIASIAHDLKNPLSAITMASEILNSKEKNQHATIINNQTKHLDRLVTDLLDTTRIESGQLDLDIKVHDIRKIILESVELYKISSKIHKISAELPDYAILCKCDASRISQVINNLISNAIKYSPNGGNIQVALENFDNYVTISIVDQGIGIAENDYENIFKPFHRTKSTKGTIPGIGLGLSSSKKIIEHHQGQLSVNSRQGKGSTFKIQLSTVADTKHLSKFKETSQLTTLNLS